MGRCLALARGETGKREGAAGAGPAAERGGGFGRVVFMPTGDAPKSPRVCFPFLEQRGAVFPRLTWDACSVVPLPAGGLGGRGRSRDLAGPRVRKMTPLGGFPWASGGFRLSWISFVALEVADRLLLRF